MRTLDAETFTDVKYSEPENLCKGKKREAAMARSEKVLEEIIRGIQGLVTLNEWEQTLLKDLRAKAEIALRPGPDPDRPEDEGPGREP